MRSLLRSTRAALLLVLLAGLVPACKSTSRHGSPPTTYSNRNIRYGMPAAAKADPNSRNAYLLERPEYVVSYNDFTKCPNWVSWQLTSADIGDSPRGSFEGDPLLPSGFRRVSSSTYDGCGFDRGHMCNSKDRSDTPEHNDATFFMTNIVPQAPNNNQQGWEEFESYCRTLAREGKELYIVCGPAGVGGTGSHGSKTMIGPPDVQVTVPSFVWKVVMVLPSPGATPDKNTRTIGIWMPNDQSVHSDWSPYITSVRDIEDKTGFTFFSEVPADIAKVIKSKVDTGK
ncbi:MAG: DNA/RNA non-specific endonuclease [Gemmataceae bacterium]|nr:DNA/RNA non-specific endonuclease [Gemmataceae bacterium]